MCRPFRLAACVSWGLLVALPAASAANLNAELWGLSLGVADVGRATDFYGQALGFQVLSEDALGAHLYLGELHLLLHRSEHGPAPWQVPRAYLNLSVDDLPEAISAVVRLGGGVFPGGPNPSAVGSGFTVLDPDGHPMNLIDHPWDDDDEHEMPVRLFNIGLHAVDKLAYEDFFARLGIGVRTRDYLPRTLVMEQHGAAQIVLHDAAQPAPGETMDRGTLLFVTTDPLDAEVVSGLQWAESRQGLTWLELRSPSGTPLQLYDDHPWEPSPRP